MRSNGGGVLLGEDETAAPKWFGMTMKYFDGSSARPGPVSQNATSAGCAVNQVGRHDDVVAGLVQLPQREVAELRVREHRALLQLEVAELEDLVDRHTRLLVVGAAESRSGAVHLRGARPTLRGRARPRGWERV